MAETVQTSYRPPSGVVVTERWGFRVSYGEADISVPSNLEVLMVLKGKLKYL